jgi:flagellar biosynthesis protein FlhA
MILTDAHAGEVIGAIGAFAVQGSFVIGLVVFFILVIVQYVVVTSGAQRVSEVAARFVLDSVPGQQMSIDADLNMGLIDQNEAKRRRKELEKEASFYGAMDGASKFVKGDAIAGVIILLINIFAGWIIGVAQMQLDWLTALQTFTLLTIGDGIVSQVPALIISIATGIIVTRSSSDRQLSAEIISQLGSVPRIPVIVIGALVLLMLMPGMPKWPIAVLVLAAGALWLSARRRRREALAGTLLDQPDTDKRQAETKGVAPIEVLLGKELSGHWQSLKPVLTERIGALRVQQEKLSGLSFPAVIFQDGADLGPHDYEIMLQGSRFGHSQLYPESTLAIRANGEAPTLPGVQARDPAFGLPGVWINDSLKDRARDEGYTLIDPITVLITHLGEVLRAEAPQLLSRADVIAMLEAVRARQPGLVEELIPAIMTISDIQRVLQNLLAEEVSIRNIDQICEALIDSGRGTKDHSDLTELVRQRLSNSICHGLRGRHDQLSVLSLNPRVEAQLSENIRRAEGATAFVIEPRLAEGLMRKLIPATDDMLRQSLNPVLLCGPEIRRHLRAFTRRTIPRLAILSVNEVPHTIDLKSFAIVTVD